MYGRGGSPGPGVIANRSRAKQAEREPEHRHFPQWSLKWYAQAEDGTLPERMMAMPIDVYNFMREGIRSCGRCYEGVNAFMSDHEPILPWQIAYGRLSQD